MKQFKFPLGCAVFLFIVGFSNPAKADYVLLQNGTLLFNVVVEDSDTTASRPMRIRNRANGVSFEYNPKNESVKPLPGTFGTFMVADYVKSYENMGKARAKEIVSQKSWQRYVPPPVKRIIAPTPEPKHTATPITTATVNQEKLPNSVVSASEPLPSRLQKQLNLFVKEQSRVSFDANTSVARGLISTEKATEVRIRWLENQIRILKTYYPVSDAEVSAKIKQWEDMVEETKRTGKYMIE